MKELIIGIGELILNALALLAVCAMVLVTWVLIGGE